MPILGVAKVCVFGTCSAALANLSVPLSVVGVGGVATVRLVTPIFISTSMASAAVIPAFGFLTLHSVPEPGTILLVGAGIVGLVAFGRRRG
jgi:hypothetical protein